MKFAVAFTILSLFVPALAQSSSAAAASASGSAAAASGASGNGTASYLTALLGALTAANLTGLVSVATGIAATAEGQAFLGSLAVGNKTVFAPSNEAFAAVPSSVSSNTTLLTQILSYHIINTSYTPAGVATSPNHSIARTLLPGRLPGNRTLPVVLTKNGTNATSISVIQYNANISAMGPVTAGNLQVYIIPQVLTPPPDLGTVGTALFPTLAQTASSVGLLGPLASASGLTIFAPNDAAFSAAGAALASLMGNSTLITNVLANHVINGTVAYSDRLTTANYTSAAGSPFTFMSNTTGTYVMSGNSTARIVQSDVIYNAGVVHIIDAVLANPNGNASAAAAAYTSNTAAATSMEPTGARTASSNPAAASGSAAASSRSAGSKAVFNLPVAGLATLFSAMLVGGGYVMM